MRERLETSRQAWARASRSEAVCGAATHRSGGGSSWNDVLQGSTELRGVAAFSRIREAKRAMAGPDPATWVREVAPKVVPRLADP